MQIKAATGKPNRFKTEALIVSHYENDTDLTAEAAAVDGALNGTIARLVKDGDIKSVTVQAKATREWTRHYALAPGGRVEIINANGPIEAVVGPDGAVDITAVCVVCAPEGIAALERVAPDLKLVTASIDDGLNDVAYIVPGLGDAGDRQFGPR